MSATQCQCTNGPLLSFKRSSLIGVGSENTKVKVQRHDSENTRPRPAWTWNGKKAALDTHTVQQLQALKHSMIRCFSFQTISILYAYVCACGLWQCFLTLKQQRINLLHGRRHTLYIWSWREEKGVINNKIQFELSFSLCYAIKQALNNSRSKLEHAFVNILLFNKVLICN